MNLNKTKTTFGISLVIVLLGGLYTLAAILSSESPNWEINPLGFVRLHCADSTASTGFLFSNARWFLSFNLYLCFPWPLLILGTFLVRWLQGRLDD